MISRRLAVLVALVTMASGCVTVANKPLPQDAAEKLPGKSFVPTRYAKPDFTAMTAGKAAFGLIGVAAMVKAGNDIVNQNQVADPAVGISTAIASRLVEKRNMTEVPAGDATAANDQLAVLATTFPNADYLLDVKTMSWMFGYYPGNWSHYRVLYNARIRLIDASTKDVLAESMCKAAPVDDQNPPTRDQLLENEAALLKQYLDKATTDCVEVLSTQVLGL